MPHQRWVPLLALAVAAPLVSGGCSAEPAVASPAALGFERGLQERFGRWTRVHEPSPTRLVVVLQRALPRHTAPEGLSVIARMIARAAYHDGIAAAGDTVAVEFHRTRRLGPFDFGASVVRFTFTAPPAEVAPPRRDRPPAA